MRREILQPDAHGRVDLAQLGLEDEVVVADEVAAGKWMLMSEQAANEPESEPDRARAEEQGLIDPVDEAPTPPEPTVTHGSSRGRIERPQNMPRAGSRRPRRSSG